MRAQERTEGLIEIDAEEALPPGARLLHIGLRKTGTTTIQVACHRNRESLALQGVHYAGPGSRPKLASGELVSHRERQGHWDALVAEVRGAGDQRVCISSETFSRADPERASEAVSALGGESVHVVLVVRPLDGLLPSQWQQRVHGRRRIASFTDWLDSVLDESSDDRDHRDFWVAHDLERIVANWRAAAPDRLTVLVPPPGDRAFLPTWFERRLGLREGTLHLPRGANTSIGLPSAEVLRRLDREALDRGWPSRWYDRGLRDDLVSHLQRRPRHPDEPPILIPARYRDRIAEIDSGRADFLEGAGVHLGGDVEALRREPAVVPDVEVAGPVPIPAPVSAELLATGLDLARNREQQARQEAARQRRRTEGLSGRGPRVDELTARQLARVLVGRAVRRVRALGRGAPLTRGTPRRDAAHPPRG